MCLKKRALTKPILTSEHVGGDWDAALALATNLQQKILETVNLTASFGIAPTRLVAKMASEVNKPNGVFRVMPDEVQSFFGGVPWDIPGIGPKRRNTTWPSGATPRRMNSTSWASYHLHAFQVNALQRGSYEWLTARAAMWSVRCEVVNQLKEHTFERDQNDHEEVMRRLEQLVSLVMERAVGLGVSGRLAESKNSLHRF